MRSYQNYAAIIFELIIVWVALCGLERQLRLSNIEVVEKAGISKAVDLPYSTNTAAMVEFTFRGQLEGSWINNNPLRIVGDNCVVSVKVDGRDVDLSKVKQGERCNYNAGFLVYPGAYLKSGETHDFEIKVLNLGGPGGLKIELRNREILGSFWGIVLMIAAASLLYQLSLCCGLARKMALILVLGLMLRFSYLSWTSYQERAYDVGGPTGHRGYISYVATHKSLPNFAEGWEFYQPPLYYIAAALYSNALFEKNSPFQNFFLQTFSLFLSMGFVLFSALIFHQATAGSKLGNWCLLLFVFWPSTVIHSVRISNDPMSYFIYAVALYFIFKWKESNYEKYLIHSILAASTGLFVKFNTIALLGLLAWLLIRELYSAPNKKVVFIRDLGVLAVLVCFFIASILRNLISYYQGRVPHLFIPAVNSLAGKLYIGNELWRYLYFDLRNFLQHPFTSAWEDEKGRLFFWNYLLKTSLFGEFSFNDALHRNLAVLASFALCFLAVLLLIGFVLCEIKNLSKYELFLANALLLMLSLISVRIQVPAACASDFRYILPLLISVCSFLELSLVVFQKRGLVVLKYATYLTCSIFVTSSLLFFGFPLRG